MKSGPSVLSAAPRAMLSSTLRTLPARLQRRWLAQEAAASGATGPYKHLDQLIATAPAVGVLIAAAGGLAVLGTYLVDTHVKVEVSAVIAQNAALGARLDARLDGLTKEVDAKTAGLASSVIKEVDAKNAWLASSVTTEVDAKTAGLASSVTKEVDAKMAGQAREVDAKVAGVIAAAAMKAEAETLRVLKEYKVRAMAGSLFDAASGGEASP